MNKRWTVVVERPRPHDAEETATYIGHIFAKTINSAIHQGRVEAIANDRATGSNRNEKDWRVLVVFPGHHNIEYQA